MDSTIAVTQTVIDSSTAAGWLAPLVAQFDWIPPWAQLIVLGFASSLLVDAVEWAMVKAKAVPWAGPVIAWLLTRWAKNPRIISPLILFGVTSTAAGSAGIGAVIAALAAGFRSMTTRRNVMLNPQDKTKITKLSHAALILGALMLAQAAPVHAVDIPKAASNAWVLSKVNIGVENKWLASANASFHDSKPTPQFFGRWEVSLPVLKLAVHLEGARRIDKDRPWEARAGFSVRVK